MKKEAGFVFIFFGLLALLGGSFFGCIAALQFVFPEFLKDIPFVKTRPLHVSLVVAWIFFSAIGVIYYFLQNNSKVKIFSDTIPKIHFWTFLFTGALILACYVLGIFGGREYWEFPAILSIPIFISWLLFGWNYFKTVFQLIGQWPVYLWMWATGIVFFFITFSEAHLWLFPYFRNNIVRDLTVQWKANGALVGSWNMLVYGTAIFVMERIRGDESIAKSKIAYLMFFLGFTNLLFGWAHHIYILPSARWVRILSYVISMTELLILAKIIWNWKKSLSEVKKYFHFLPIKFLIAADFWIFINLTLAIAISVPAINVYTHGTHVTVAHAMGSTIGINTMILLASCVFLVLDAIKVEFRPSQKRMIHSGFWVLNFSLLIFWLCLIFAGIEKGMLVIENKLTFSEIMERINPTLTLFAFSGLGIFSGLIIIVLPTLKTISFYWTKK